MPEPPAGYVSDPKPRTANVDAMQHRPDSSVYAILPQDSTGMGAQQHPQTSGPPQANAPRQTSINTRNMQSPSEMFGGVEQLIRDSQDWVYRDQTQIATGFGNWASMNMDPSTWANAALVPDDMMATGAPSASGMSTTMNVSNVQAPMANAWDGSMDNAGYPVMDWLNTQTMYNNAVSYNEDDWYD